MTSADASRNCRCGRRTTSGWHCSSSALVDPLDVAGRVGDDDGVVGAAGDEGELLGVAGLGVELLALADVAEVGDERRGGTVALADDADRELDGDFRIVGAPGG